MKDKKLILILVLLLISATLFIIFNRTSILPQEPNIILREELSPQAGLPEAVEAKRQAIFKATQSRDYAKLASVAEPAANFHYSFGGEYESGFEGYLRLAETTEKESAFDIIPTLLKLQYTYKADTVFKGLYTWPSVFTKEPSKWTEEDLNMMRTFLTKEQIQSYREYGGYIYYRLGITEQGKWVFYLAGD